MPITVTDDFFIRMKQACITCENNFSDLFIKTVLAKKATIEVNTDSTKFAHC